jgi:hypothetical protein
MRPVHSQFLIMFLERNRHPVELSGEAFNFVVRFNVEAMFVMAFGDDLGSALKL